MLRAPIASMIARMRLPIIAVSGAIAAWSCLAGIANAVEANDEPATLAGERTIAQDEPAAGESVGEPAEDAPVEGEPAAGEAPKMPADDPSTDDAGVTDGGDAPASDERAKE